MDTEALKQLMAEMKVKLQSDAQIAELEAEFWAAHRQRIAEVRNANLAADQREAILQAQIKELRETLALLASGRSVPNAAPTGAAAIPASPASMPAPTSSASTSAAGAIPGARHVPPPTLGSLINDFLDGYPKEKKAGMFKKHQAALRLLKQLQGEKPVDRLRQTDLVDFFEVVERLPPRWQQQCTKLKVTPRELSQQEHSKALGKKTFEDNYVVPVRLLLKWARTRWQDQGFPVTLTTEGIEFSGEDDEGDNKQRALTQDELRHLFDRALAPYRADEGEDHKWWLPVLEFYSGARVNELCQLNPQTDFGLQSGIHFIRITAQTASDERIKKSVKTGDERYVPLHPDLVSSGFLDYVARVRKAGHKLLFPKWQPTNKRASTQAERWFRDLLRSEGLRDETPGRRVVGFHAFRHTLLARAANSSPQVDAGPITGHADGSRSGTQRSYEGELSLERKLERLCGIQFGFNPFLPND